MLIHNRCLVLYKMNEMYRQDLSTCLLVMVEYRHFLFCKDCFKWIQVKVQVYVLIIKVNNIWHWRSFRLNIKLYLFICYQYTYTSTGTDDCTCMYNRCFTGTWLLHTYRYIFIKVKKNICVLLAREYIFYYRKDI